MPLFSPGPLTSPGIGGTQSNVTTNILNSYTPPGPTIGLQPTSLQFQPTNPQGLVTPYGGIGPGSARGGGHLSGASGAMLT